MQTELTRLITALQEFYAAETFLLERDLGERALTHRLAVYIEKHFSGWQVDCEFDRLGERTMLLPHGTVASTDDHLGKSIYPDIVVHQRDIPNNLLAIEVRKASNHQPIEHEQHKLKGLTDPHLWFAYAIGAMVTLAKTHVTHSEVYAGGRIDPPMSIWLARHLKDAGLSEESGR